MGDRAVLVVTKFACQRPETPLPSAEWIAERADLLARVPAPGLAATETPLTWVLQAHPTLVEATRDAVDAVSLPLPVTVTAQDVDTADDVAPGSDRFLTFRLDSDDALLPSTVDRLSQWPLAHPVIVDLCHGIQLNWETGEAAHYRLHRPYQGPFLAVTHDSRESMLSVGGHHRLEARTGRRLVRYRRPAWVQVLHGGNVSNGWRPVSIGRMARMNGWPLLPGDRRYLRHIRRPQV